MYYILDQVYEKLSEMFMQMTIKEDKNQIKLDDVRDALNIKVIDILGLKETLDQNIKCPIKKYLPNT